MIGKKLTLLLVLFIGGTALIYIGGKNFIHTRKLAAEGKPTVATVLDQKAWKVYKEQKTHHLTVAFQAESGQTVTNDVMVTRAIFEGVSKGGSVGIYYLPKNPAICVVANHVEVQYGQFFMGWACIGAGVLVLIFFIKFPTPEPMTEVDIVEQVRPMAAEGAQKIVKQLAPLTETKHEFERVEARRSPHLDQQFYNSQQRFLESHGFVLLEDCEDATLRKSASNPNTFIRVMLSEDGSIMAGMYHFKPSLLLRAAGVKDIKALDFDTQFSNGCFVCTTNAEESGKLNQPAEVDNLALASGTPSDKLLEAHRQRVKAFTARMGAQPMHLKGIAGVRQSGDELQRLKAEHRRRTGLSREELKKLGGGNKGDQESDLLFEEILKEHGRVKAGKAGKL